MTKRAARASDIARASTRPRSRRVARRSSAKKRIKTFFALAILLVEIPVALGLVFGLFTFWKFSLALPNIETLAADVKAATATKIWSQDGVLLAKLDTVNRQPILIGDISKDLVNATVSIEDHRFYEHPGVDLQGIARAAWVNVSGGGAREGASTLTQQLVRNVDDFGLTKEKRLSRKIREAMTALWVEKGYSKPEILQLCLNNFYYGAGAYGVQAASLTYFGKPASKLTLAEAAMLAGLPQRPNDFTPFHHRKAAIKRRDEVLDSMLRWGYITQQQCDKAKAQKPRLMPPPERKNQDFKAPYFVTYVLKDLFKNYGAEFVYSGLKIDTTLNYKMQLMAEKTLENGIRAHSEAGVNQGALICLDNKTGYIRAMVGGRNFRAEKFNAVTQGRRQPGSTFKIFDYTAAFNEGKAGIDTTFEDKPIPYPNNPKKVVRNFSPGYTHAPMTCRAALMHSTNTIAVQVAQTVGVHKVIEYAHRMGITTPLVPVLPTALGASEVRPLDLCSAYSIFPMKGNRCLPMGLVRVTDADGNLLEEHIPQIKTNLLKPETVSQLDEMMAGVVEHGTGIEARGNEGSGIVDNARGKTGTTTDSKDAWFAGYTPELSTVIWVANVRIKKTNGVSRHVYHTMGGTTGGHVCAPIWHDFMINAVPEQQKFKPVLQANILNSGTPNGAPETTAVQHVRRRIKRNELTDSERKDGITPAADDTDAESNEAAASPTAAENKAEGENAANTAEQNTASNGVAPQPSPPRVAPEVSGDPDASGSPEPPAPAPPRPAPSRSQPVVSPPVSAIPTSLPATPARTTPRPVRVASAAPARHSESPPSGSLRARTPALAVHSDPPSLVSVNVCVDSGGRATEYCPAFRTVQMSKAKAAHLRRCRVHRPPPGEG